MSSIDYSVWLFCAVLLSQINNHGLPTKVYAHDHLSTFSQPHEKDGRMNKNWSSMGDMVDKRIEHEKVLIVV